MMRLAIALAFSLTTAHAADIPQSSQRDNRIQYVNYHPGDVVVVHASAGFVSRIVFEPGETVLTPVHTGFTDGWDITARGRILTLQPLSAQDSSGAKVRPNPRDWNTNIAVETNKRLYDFEVRLLPENYSRHNAKAFYRVEFRYPIESESAARAQAAEQRRQQQASEQRPVLPVARNTRYSMRIGKGSEDIAPTMAYDDGLFTYLRFPNNREMPAVFLVASDGVEGIVNTHVHESRRDVLVIQRVARQLILRLGNSVIAIDNDAFDIDGMPPINGTSVPGMNREVAP